MSKSIVRFGPRYVGIGKVAVAAAATAFALLISGCGSSSSTATAPTSSAAAASGATSVPAAAVSGAAGSSAPSGDVPATPVDSAAVALLPASIKSAGTLNVAIPTNEPPTQYYKEGTKDMTGINPDIARLIGESLGLKVTISVANFDSIIPGIAAGRYDMTVSSMTPTTKRMEVLDFVDYMQVGNTIVVNKSNPEGIRDPMGLCGRKVGFLTASYQITVNVPTYNTACVAAGKEKIISSEYQDTRQAISALTSGRQDAVLADSPILDFAVSQNLDLAIAARYEFAPVSVGMPKDAGLVKAVGVALAGLIKTDAYKKVLAKYGVSSGAITAARVNFAQ